MKAGNKPDERLVIPASNGHLMDGCPVPLLHLIKLINAADALVCQHQGPAFKHHFLGDWVSLYSCSQAHPRGALASGIHRSG